MNNHPISLGEEASVAQDLRGANPGAPRRVIALTADEALSRSLAELSSAGFDVAVVGDAEALSEELLQSASSIALIDSSAAGSALEGLVDALAAQFPDLRLMVAGHGTEQNQLATRIASGRVFRFVHKPASPQRLKLMVDAASRPAEPHRVSVTQTVQVLSDPALVGGGAQRAGGPPERDSRPWLLIGIGVALALATAALLLWPDGQDAPPAATAPAGPVQSSLPEVNDLVRRADQAFAEGRYVGSDGTSAAELYRDAQKLDPQDARARDGFTRGLEYGLRSAEQALLATNLDEATRITESLRLMAPTNSRLSFLQSQIDRELARTNQDASVRSAWEAKQAQIRFSVDRMQQRIGAGALLDPSSDSAMTHFRSAEESGPGDVLVRNARDGLLAALLNTADGRLEAGDTAGARRLVDAAASLNSGAPGLDPLRRRLGARNSATAATVNAGSSPPAAATQSGPTPAELAMTDSALQAAPAPAAGEPADGAGAIPATALKRVRMVPPVYPQRALDELVSGWVDLEFTVDTKGVVRDVEVLGSEPARIFDSAAVNALRRWRFEPVLRDGVAVETRARQRLSFKANEE